MSTPASRTGAVVRVTNRLEGVRFGRLEVVRYGGYTEVWDGRRIQRRRLWVCRCDCDGGEATYREDKLKKGDTRSCGCLKGGTLKYGAGLTPHARSVLRRKGEVEDAKRLEEFPLVRGWWELFRRLKEERGLQLDLLAARCGWKRNFLMDEFFGRSRIRPPSVAEAEVMAGGLNLRGWEKAEFLRVAREAREAVAKVRSVTRAERAELLGALK